MSESVPRTGRGSAGLQSHTSSPDNTDRPSDKPTRRNATERRDLLARILNTPGLERVVPQLPPDLLHRVIRTCGLEDCGEVIALATSEQLEGIFDIDLWRAYRPGRDEQFDADRFGVWLEVLVEVGAEVAAQKLAGIDVDLVVAGLAKHAIVLDRAAVTPYETMDGQQVDPIHCLTDDLTSDIGGYLLVARRTDSWDAIVEVLMSLEAGHPDYFHKVMWGCRALSNTGHEIDGLDDLLSEGDQVMFHLEVDREQRREKKGYVTPAQARAFLKMSRQLHLGSDKPANSVAHAYFRGRVQEVEQELQADDQLLATAVDSSSAPENNADGVGTVLDILLDAGILAPSPRALLSGSENHSERFGHTQTYMQLVLDNDPSAYSIRSEQLAYLANTLMSGCSIQGRSFSAQEASDAALAVCNLGLQNWPAHWFLETAAPGSFPMDADLVSIFEVGWVVLHKEVSMYTAEQLIRILTGLRCNDHELQSELNSLRVVLAKHLRAGAPWRARNALDAIAPLDLPAWAVLLALIDEFPVLHKSIGAPSESRTRSVRVFDFDYISENSQITTVREFLTSLPAILRG